MATIAVSGIRQDLKRIISSSLGSALHQNDGAGLGRLSGLSSCETLRLEGTAGCDLNQTPLVCAPPAPLRPAVGAGYWGACLVGAPTPIQLVASKPGTNSLTVGMFGNACERGARHCQRAQPAGPDVLNQRDHVPEN